MAFRPTPRAVAWAPLGLMQPTASTGILVRLRSLRYHRVGTQLLPNDPTTTHMAMRDRDWPGYNEWYCCPTCHRLWTFQGKEVVALDPKYALGPAKPSRDVTSQVCTVCEGGRRPVAEI